MKGCKPQYDEERWVRDIESKLHLASLLVDKEIQLEKAAELLIRVGAASKLHYATSSGYMHECITHHGVEEKVFEILENTEAVKKLLNSIASEASKALEEWDTATLRKALDLLKAGSKGSVDRKPAEKIERPIEAAIELTKLGAAPPGIEAIAMATAYAAGSFLEYLGSVLEKQLREVEAENPALRIVRESYSTIDRRCYTVHETDSGYIARICIATEPPGTSQGVEAAIAIDPLAEECNSRSAGRIIIVAAPRRVAMCGDVDSEISRELASAIKSRLETSIKIYREIALNR